MLHQQHCLTHLSRQVSEKVRILVIGSYRSSEVLAKEAQHPIQEISRELQRLYGDSDN